VTIALAMVALAATLVRRSGCTGGPVSRSGRMSGTPLIHHSTMSAPRGPDFPALQHARHGGRRYRRLAGDGSAAAKSGDRPPVNDSNLRMIGGERDPRIGCGSER
jgi:hypothetical protein